MDSTWSPIVTDSNEEQYPNALSPIEVTESGIVIEVNWLQKENAPSPIEVTSAGNNNDVLLGGYCTRVSPSLLSRIPS